MNRLHQQLLAAGLLASLAASAFSQTAPPAGNPGRPDGQQFAHRAGPMDPARLQEHHGRMEKRMAERMEFFKFKLKVTPAQESAWNDWTAAMKPPATHLQRPDRAEFERLSTPERIDRMRALRTARQTEMDRKMDATKTFYTALDAGQKKVFDSASLEMLRHRGGGRGAFEGNERHHRG